MNKICVFHPHKFHVYEKDRDFMYLDTKKVPPHSPPPDHKCPHQRRHSRCVTNREK